MNLIFQSCQLACRLGVLNCKIGMPALRHLRNKTRVAEVKEASPSQIRVTQHPMNDLQSSNRVARIISQPWMGKLSILRYLVGDRTVALAEYGDKEWSRTFDLIEDDLQNLTLLGFFLGHTPPKIQINQMQPPLGTPLPQLREDHLDQVVPLRMHISKGTADENSNRSPSRGHSITSYVCLRISNPTLAKNSGILRTVSLSRSFTSSGSSAQGTR